jgi:hypothetical protein
MGAPPWLSEGFTSCLGAESAGELCKDIVLNGIPTARPDLTVEEFTNWVERL